MSNPTIYSGGSWFSHPNSQTIAMCLTRKKSQLRCLHIQHQEIQHHSTVSLRETHLKEVVQLEPHFWERQPAVFHQPRKTPCFFGCQAMKCNHLCSSCIFSSSISITFHHDFIYSLAFRAAGHFQPAPGDAQPDKVLLSRGHYRLTMKHCK